MDARAGNDRIAEKAKRLHFLSRVPMLCECSAPSCRTIVMISLEGFAEIRGEPDTFLAAPGHADDGTELRRREPGYTIRRSIRCRFGGDRRSA